MDFYHLARWLIYLGLGIAFLGCLIWLFGKAGIPLGSLPGDISIQKKKFSLYFPIVTSISLSIFLTLLINLLLWIFRK